MVHYVGVGSNIVAYNLVSCYSNETNYVGGCLLANASYLVFSSQKEDS